MPALLFNLSLGELVAIGVVALLVFGRKLPEVAAQLAVQAQRARRALQDLRRETGIDREIWEVRRRFEEAVPRDVESPTAAFEQARLEARTRLRGTVERRAAGAAPGKPGAAAEPGAAARPGHPGDPPAGAGGEGAGSGEPESPPTADEPGASSGERPGDS